MTTELSGNRVFKLLFAIGALQSVVRWLELLAFGVFVYDSTGSALYVAMVTLAKLAPLALFGPLIGAMPSRFTHRGLYLCGLLFMLLTMLGGVVLTISGQVAIWHILIISFFGGIFWVLDFPVRRSMIGDAVTRQVLGRAMTVDTLANNGTRLLGPLLGGALLQYTGLLGTFVLGFFVYLLCAYLTYRLPQTALHSLPEQPTSIVSNIREGFAVVRQDQMLKATLMITVIYNLFAFPLLSLVPVLGRDELKLSASIIGLLASMEGGGALLGGILLIVFGRIRFYRKIYVFGLICSFIFSLYYAVTDSALLMGSALLAVGIGSACFAAMQSTLLILNSSAQFRSQIFGLLSVSIGTGLIGFSLIGVMAITIGARATILVSSICGLASVLVICLRWPQIISVQPSTEHP